MIANEGETRVRRMGVFPPESSVIQPVGSVLMETSDEWQVGRRFFSKESMRKHYEPEMVLMAEPAPLRLTPVH